MRAPEESLSPAQLEIMEIVWEKGEVAAVEVRQSCRTDANWRERQCAPCSKGWRDKGWLKHRAVGRTFFYSAAVLRGATAGQKVIELIDTVCGGSPERLMTAAAGLSRTVRGGSRPYRGTDQASEKQETGPAELGDHVDVDRNQAREHDDVLMRVSFVLTAGLFWPTWRGGTRRYGMRSWSPGSPRHSSCPWQC